MIKIRAVILVLLLVLASRANAQFDCSNGFSSTPTNPCGIHEYTEHAPFWVGPNVTPADVLSGTSVTLLAQGATHLAGSLIYQTKVNVQSFNSSFRFVPNGQNFIWMAQNTDNNPMFNGPNFNAGAGCEANFFQGYAQPNPPNNVFAVDFDSYSGLEPNTSSPGNFVHSSVQIYKSNLPVSEYPNRFVQCPCIGGSNICGDNTNPSDGLYQIAKNSTAPVPLNSPASALNTSTGHTYLASLAYDGSRLTVDLYDETAGGPHFTHTWNNVDIPASVGSNVAWVGVGGATNEAAVHALVVHSFTYTEGMAKPPSPTATSTPTPPGSPCSFTSRLGTVTWQCE